MNPASLANGHREASRGNFQAAYAAFVASGMPEGEVHAGICAAIMGDQARAKDHFERAHARDPRDQHVRRFLGMALSEAGEPGRAIDLLAEFTDPDSLFCRANAALALGRLEEAAKDYRRVVKQNPSKAAAWANLGIVLQRLGRPEAEAHLLTAIKANPKMVPAVSALADLLRDSGRVSESIARYEEALRLSPDDAPARLGYGQALQLVKRFDDALDAYAKCIAIAPEQPAAYINRAQVLAEQGSVGAARDDLSRARALGVSWVSWREALMMPPIMQSNEEIDACRSRLEAFLDAGILPPLSDPSTQVAAPGFFLAYHGRNNASLHRRIAAGLLASCPALKFEAAHSRKAGAKVRVVFASAHFRDHTVGLITEGLIAKLDRSQFEVHVVRPHGTSDSVTQRIEKSARSHTVSADPFQAREEIAKIEADAIYFPDIGMEPWSYYLGFARLAPFQCVGWGHADTTGLPEIDAYLSCTAFDPSGAESYYTEELLRADRILACMQPAAQSAFLPLPSGRARRYICPQSLFKIHPDMDAAMRALLEIDAEATIAFPEAPHPQWQAQLQKRWGKLAERVVFVPRVAPERFTTWLAEFDAILDPIHFTGGYSSFQALCAGLPVVTWAGDHLPGRMTAGMLQQMGTDGLVASSAEQFASIAHAVAGQPNGWREQIFGQREGLISDERAVRSFENLLMQGILARRT